MTEDHDDVSELPELPADDDAYVTALLASLPDVPMPADVRARIDAALADLSATPAPATAATVLPGGVIPISAARSRWRNPRILQAAAAVVLVVAAVAVGIQSLSSKSTPTSADSAGGSGSAARSEAATTSGTAYTTDTLAAGIRQLVARSGHVTTSGGQTGTSKSTATPGPQVAGEPPAAAPSDAAALAFSVDALAACISVIEDSTTYTQPIAIDAATYNGQSALLVVLSNPDDPATYGVWIVAPSCGQDGDAHLITYAAVPRT